MQPASSPQIVRFGTFEVDLRSAELRKNGLKLKLTGQPFQVLSFLLERPGEVVSREELQRRLWPDTFVDVDHSLNMAINKIREVLDDSADTPRFIETLPRRGYRFIAPIIVNGNAATTAAPAAPPVSAIRRTVGKKLAVWSVLGGTCILAGVFAYLKFRHTPVLPSFTSVPLTALPGVEISPAFSPDGSQFAFGWTGEQASESKGFDLYVKAIGSEKLLRLTDRPSDWISAAWSPDGRQIMFHRVSKTDSSLNVVPAIGGPERKLRSTHASTPLAAGISWSPDGQFIAFADSPTAEGRPRIQVLSMRTLESAQIQHDEKCRDEIQPAFSHDGKQLAYACFLSSGNDYAVLVARMDGAAPKIVRSFAGWPFGIAWTGDDKSLIFPQFQIGGDHNGLLELQLNDTSIRKLPFGENAEYLAISPKGDRIAYGSGSEANNNIWRLDLAQRQTVKLISSTHEQFCPQYSPDGKHIAFASSRGGNFEIWMSEADGSNLEQLTKLGNPITGTPNWSPDSKRIVFDSRQSGHANIYVVDISERVVRKVVTTVAEASVPSWSHDGKWIYFIGDTSEGGAGIIYRCPAAGGDATPLSTMRGYLPVESLDEQVVYFATGSTAGETVLAAASLKPTGTESRVEGMPPLSFGENWTIDRNGVYFYPAQSPETLSYFDFATKKVRPIYKVRDSSIEVGTNLLLGLSVSPDGRYILYPLAEIPNRDIMLVEHFH